jgi:MFS family permease
MTPAPLPVVKLTRWHRRLVVWTSLLLSLSGIVWIAMHYGIEYAPDYDGPEARKWIHLVLQAHGIVAYGAAIMLGTLLGRHIPSALRGWPWRWSGVVLLTLATALIATALMLYYVADEELREVASFVHQVSGLVAAGLAVSHFGRASRVKKAAGADVQPGAV